MGNAHTSPLAIATWDKFIRRIRLAKAFIDMHRTFQLQFERSPVCADCYNMKRYINGDIVSPLIVSND